MKRTIQRILTVLLMTCSIYSLRAQIHLGPAGSEADSSAALDIQSTTQGVLIPRMTTHQRDSIVNPSTGLLVFNSDSLQFHFYNGSVWEKVNQMTVTTSIADADGDTEVHVEKNTDEDVIRFDMGGTEYFRMDSGRLEVVNTGNSVFIGEGAGQNDHLSNENVYIGRDAGKSGTTAGANTVIGAYSGSTLTSGNENVAVGKGALSFVDTAGRNVALGVDAGYHTTGGSGIYIGHQAGYHETGADRLYIENSDADSTDALIYGNFDSDLLLLNAHSGVNFVNDNVTLTVRGDTAEPFIFLVEDTVGDNFFVVRSTGNVGIGSNSPQFKFELLHKEDALNTAGDHVYTPGLAQVMVRRSNDTGASIGIGFQSSTEKHEVGAAIVHERTGTKSQGHLHFATRDQPTDDIDSIPIRMTITDHGNVGIGALDPQAKLEVQGGIRYVDGNQDEGHLLTCDVDGDAIWVDPSSLQVGALSDDDDDTGINVDDGMDDDIIRFDMEGTEFFRMDSGRLEVIHTDGSIYIGENAGVSDQFENANVFIGKSAGAANTNGQYNVALGPYTLENNTDGGSNTAIGSGALYSNIDGSGNVALGESALFDNETGGENMVLGAYAMADNVSGSSNVVIGFAALRKNDGGSENTIIGNGAGYNNTSGDGNVFIGSHAGYNESGSDKLYIDNSNTSSPLIYGDFNNDFVRINGELDLGGNLHTNGNWISNDGDDEGIYLHNNGWVAIGSTVTSDLLHVTGPDANNTDGTRIRVQSTTNGYAGLVAVNTQRNIFIGIQGSGDPNPGEFHIYDNTSGSRRMVIDQSGEMGVGVDNPSYKLHVNGQVAGNGAYVNTSDEKYKTNIQPIQSAMDQLTKLEGVRYEWNTEAYSDKHFDERTQLGFIAQDVEDIVPEAVSKTSEGDYGLSYSTFIPLVVEAVKELNDENRSLKEENEQLRATIESMQREFANRLDLIENQLNK